jgi:uncharacterized protein (DUF58 family)
MRTRKCAGIVGASIIFLLLGLLFMEWQFLLALIPFIVLLFIGVLSFYNKDVDIDIKRDLSHGKIFEDDQLTVILTIKNKGKSISFLEAYDSLPSKVLVENGSNYSVLSLKKSEVAKIRYKITCPIRGHYYVGPLHVRVRDFLGLFYKEKIIENSVELTVIPRMEEINDMPVRSGKGMYPGIVHSHFAGIGTEFYGLREYTPNDAFRRINWMASARWNHLMVNEYERESIADAVIILDAREIQNAGSLKYNTLEYSIKAAVSISSYFLKQRDRVGLIVYGETKGNLRWLYPESGKKQLYKIVEELVEVRATGESCLENAIDTAIGYMLPEKSVLVLISSLESDLSIPPSVETLIARGFDVLIVSPSIVELERMLQPDEQSYELAHRILNFERGVFINRLQQSGAKVIDWNPLVPLSVSFEGVKRSRGRR